MKAITKLSGWAFAISFLGTLPLGTLNLSVVNYAFRHDWAGAAGFSVAAIFVEMMIVRVALAAIRRLERFTPFFRVFNVLTCGILLFLAFNSLLAAWQMETFRATVPFSFLNPWLAGFVLSLTNPLHLPFWMGWTGVLRSKKVLGDQRGMHSCFITAIGLGTAAAFGIYALSGGYLTRLLGSRQVLLNWVVGAALLITALIHLYKTFFNGKIVSG
ncbi:MAG TPA: hypothetical protein VHE34_04455 [Puia sp.]|uniref:hypothetical protein n=1 Tax=Puia sp. TaxID=2045100 RepID=UPI002C2C3A25|nr:hypothetical protein [Puia sp.]HVU94448.1 hypothetical protein [Puia sp.]